MFYCVSVSLSSLLFFAKAIIINKNVFLIHLLGNTLQLKKGLPPAIKNRTDGHLIKTGRQRRHHATNHMNRQVIAKQTKHKPDNGHTKQDNRARGNKQHITLPPMQYETGLQSGFCKGIVCCLLGNDLPVHVAAPSCLCCFSIVCA